MKRWIKRCLRSCVALVVAVGGVAYVQALDLDSQPPARVDSTVADLDFMRDAMPRTRGRVLAVVTSTEHFPAGQRRRASN